jgi:hypothetical protein
MLRSLVASRYSYWRARPRNSPQPTDCAQSKLNSGSAVRTGEACSSRNRASETRSSGWRGATGTTASFLKRKEDPLAYEEPSLTEKFAIGHEKLLSNLTQCWILRSTYIILPPKSIGSRRQLTRDTFQSKETPLSLTCTVYAVLLRTSGYY